jgi:TnpA family transposase
MGNPAVAYKDLLYIHQRFITRDTLRQAIATVVNRLFELRWPQLWAEGGVGFKISTAMSIARRRGL